MLCRLDIRKSVLDDIFEKFITGRYTFRQTSPETIVLLAKEGGRGKITSRPQAWKVAQELRKRIVQNYQGGVLVHIIEGDNSQPISLRFGVTPKYIDYLEKAAPKTLFNATPRIYNTGEIRYTLKSVEVLQSDKAKEIFNKGRKNNWTLDKILSELQIPKEQKELIKQIEQDFVQKQFAIYNEPVQYALELASKYSFSVEINTAKESRLKNNLMDRLPNSFMDDFGNDYKVDYSETEEGYDYFKNDIKITRLEYENAYKAEQGTSNEDNNTQHYSNLTVPGGIAYTENEIATPLIIPSIKGHAQFSTDNGIGWFRSDEQTNNSENQTENLLNEAINGNNKVYSELANVLKNHYNLHKSVTTKIVDFLKDFFGKILNGNFGNNIIELVKNLGKDNIRIFLHESIHGITSEKLAIYRGGDLSRLTQKEINAIKELERIFEKIKIELLSLKNSRGNNIFSKAVIDSHYGFTNLDEFLAEAFTNREFQSLLSNIKGEGRKPNIFKQLLNVISDLLGLNDSTILDDIFALTEEFAGNNNQNAATKTRRILEVQSDLFQKGRDKEFLVDNYKHTPGDRNFNVTYEGKEYKVGTMGGMQRVVIYKTLEGQVHYENPKQDWLTQEEIPQGLKDIVSNKFNSLKQEVLTQNKSNKENQFLQLLNKDNNWVTFFVKSIIQDSAKKGYEKVLFPTGNTASKVEGHTTLEEFKREKEDRLKSIELEKQDLQKFKNDKYIDDNIVKDGEFYKIKFGTTYLGGWGFKTKEDVKNNVKKQDIDLNINRLDNEINQLKQELERVETEGFGALKPIYNFYENTVTNILKKNYKVNQVTDEYDNTWNEVVIPYIPTPQDLVTDRTIDDLTPQQLNMFEEFYKNNQNATQEDALEYFLKCKL